MVSILITRHPKHGMTAERFEDVEAAAEKARQTAGELYPKTPKFETNTPKCWFLMENTGAPFFVPRPFPMAMIYPETNLYLGQESLPNWIILFAMNSDAGPTFMGHPAATKNMAEKFFHQMIAEHGGTIENNEFGGLTAFWNGKTVGYALEMP